MGRQLTSADDMTVVDGIQVRPEDVATVRERQQAIRAAEKQAESPQEAVGMVVVDGIQYRPEDAARLKVKPDQAPTAVTSKAARPRNKARNAPNKED